ncbi:MAG: sigma-70 family RNA polymerase sigma factor [candidate division Zixibacteria bacterium]|nr:sigma-70 family RNA polymerase sigma factor [candidate division Zixibacteria bacterium]
MSKGRLTYQNWIVDIGFDPDAGSPAGVGWGDDEIKSAGDIDSEAVGVQKTAAPGREQPVTALIRQKVAAALEHLNREEKEFITRFYYMGQSYREISEKSGRAVYKLAALHERALKKLKALLGGFVAEKFKIDADPVPTCPLCASRYRREIDQLIDRRGRKATWKPVLKLLKEQFGIKVRSPQLLIGHSRYHQRSPGADGPRNRRGGLHEK